MGGVGGWVGYKIRYLDCNCFRWNLDGIENSGLLSAGEDAETCRQSIVSSVGEVLRL